MTFFYKTFHIIFILYVFWCLEVDGMEVTWQANQWPLFKTMFRHLNVWHYWIFSHWPQHCLCRPKQVYKPNCESWPSCFCMETWPEYKAHCCHNIKLKLEAKESSNWHVTFTETWPALLILSCKLGLSSTQCCTIITDDTITNFK